MRLLPLASLSILCVLGCSSVPRGPEESINLTRRTLGPARGSYDALTLAPDGSQAFRIRISARYPQQQNSAPKQFDIDAATKAIFAQVTVPAIVPPGTPSWTDNDLRAGLFCNSGKSLMISGEMGVYYVLNLEPAISFSSLQSTIALNLGDQSPQHDSIDRPLLLGFTCAASAPVAAVALARGPYLLGTLKLFDLTTGRETASIAADFSPYGYTNLALSSNGTAAALLTERQPPQAKPDLMPFDLIQRKPLAPIATGTGKLQAAFLGESRIAVAGDNLAANAIQVFDIHTGVPVQSFQPPGQSARAVVRASADGRTILAYTGNESNQAVSGQGDALQIHRAGFTLWDTGTGKILAQSPPLYVQKIDARPLDKSILESLRPDFQLSQNGRGVLVTWPGWNQPPELYSLK